jgi:hypothetical protein
MDEPDWLSERSEEHRTRLRAVAYQRSVCAVVYRVLGALSKVDHTVQEAWLRLSRSVAKEGENLGAWLTRVVADGTPKAVRNKGLPFTGLSESRRPDSDRDPSITRAITEPRPVRLHGFLFGWVSLCGYRNAESGTRLGTRFRRWGIPPLWTGSATLGRKP